MTSSASTRWARHRCSRTTGAGGSGFNFAGLGVDGFRMGGIETCAGPDRLNVTAFVTGLTVEADGFFTGTQTPILDVSALPEPETCALVLFGRWQRSSRLDGGGPP